MTYQKQQMSRAASDADLTSLSQTQVDTGSRITHAGLKPREYGLSILYARHLTNNSFYHLLVEAFRGFTTSGKAAKQGNAGRLSPAESAAAYANIEKAGSRS